MGAELAIEHLTRSGVLRDSKRSYVFIFLPSSYKTYLKNETDIFSGNVSSYTIKSYFLKLIIVFLIFLIDNLPVAITSRFFKSLELFEPRPGWYFSVASSNYIRYLLKYIRYLNFVNKIISKINKKSNKKNKISKSGFYHIYYGDGFSLLCEDFKPFWLYPDSSSDFKPKESGGNQIFVFTHYVSNKLPDASYVISKQFCKEYLLEKYNRWFVKTTYFAILEKFIRPLSCCDKILIFTGTTMTKTSRLKYNNESSLYCDFINLVLENDNINPVNIILKFHPEGDTGVAAITRSTLENKCKLVWSKEFDVIPIEFLLIYFLNSENSFKNIYCTALTTGVAFALNLFELISPIFGFGIELNKKYLKESFVSGRVNQEKLIDSLLKKSE